MTPYLAMPPRPAWPTAGARRLHWATAPLRALNIFVVYLVLLGLWLLVVPAQDGTLTIPIVRVILFIAVSVPVAVVAAGVGVWHWWALRYWIEGDDLVVDAGIVRSRIRRIPLSRMQGVDVVRPLVGRALGLSEVHLELAGGSSAQITLRYLGEHEARALRAELLALAAGLPPHTPEAPERPIGRVSLGVLFASLMLRVPVLAAIAAFFGLVAFGIVFKELAVLAVAVPLLLGLLRGVIAPLVLYTEFSVAVAPDGIRLRYGLFETRSQTVPPGRIQAVRVVEPLMWRSFGWARVEVTVAGYSGDRQALSSTLVPVAPTFAAFDLVSEVFPGVSVQKVALTDSLSGRAAAGVSRDVFVTRRGLACRTWDVVALARAQSVRMTASPWQRLTGRATVHVDVPPGPVHVAAVDRGVVEARELTDDAVTRAALARTGAARTERWAR
ncbi:PH domain-containing protein [Actinocorallia sp. A-T 12471]|uniref:PH domain-containing protein n=1 Tax=Actinocorallia sp. A-T 12471 TaxID=3089813 RepID=UPI0029D036AF|nr:PH domain-containing protein [Actinocorallia sp. A-T 12471]MDX6741814.1 PH domain-containing protein [Actinocorallia sp. A-T 12471]